MIHVVCMDIYTLRGKGKMADRRGKRSASESDSTVDGALSKRVCTLHESEPASADFIIGETRAVVVRILTVKGRIANGMNACVM